MNLLTEEEREITWAELLEINDSIKSNKESLRIDEVNGYKKFLSLLATELKQVQTDSTIATNICNNTSNNIIKYFDESINFDDRASDLAINTIKNINKYSSKTKYDKRFKELIRKESYNKSDITIFKATARRWSD